MRHTYQYAKLSFSNESGEGKVAFMNDFKEQDWIVQADALVDWIYFLKKEYEALLQNHVVDVE